MSAIMNLFEEMESFSCDDALDDYGYVLELDTTNATMQKCSVSSGNSGYPYGIAWSDTKVYTSGTWTATASKYVAVQKYGQAAVRLYTDGSSAYRDTAIVIGDKLKASGVTAGVATHNQDATGDDTAWATDDQPTPAEIVFMVGIAREAVATTSEDGTIGGTKRIWTNLAIGGGTR